MAETLALIGLAGNIVQFVDFGINFVSKSVAIYHSADRALKENVTLEAITTDVKLLSGQVVVASATSGTATKFRNAQTCDSLRQDIRRASLRF